ncbi:hypothetical protein HDE77_000883 [Rhodanobacter sp. MP7CTX1]|nr:hypothetical protein [Rhodanobacter sp. MP7CTX1]
MSRRRGSASHCLDNSQTKSLLERDLNNASGPATGCRQSLFANPIKKS